MPTKSVLFIDSRVSNYQSFIDGLTESTETFILDGASDGLSQMAAHLYGRTGIDSIHVISHGSVATLYLGSTMLDSGNLANYRSQLTVIGSALTETGDILLYGCNVAQGDAGVQFIGNLALATGGDVAGSSNATGAEALGGDSVLERVTGQLETVGLNVNALAGLLTSNTAPTFVVGDGKVLSDTWPSGEAQVLLQQDGKIVIATTSFGDVALLRFNSDGTVDNSFGIAGKVTTDFGSSEYVRGAVLQQDGKIVVAGSSSNDFFLARYTANGSLDTSFSGDGKVKTDFSGRNDFAEDISLQNDGKILVVGTTNISFEVARAVARYDPSGVLDSTFGDGGKLLSPLNGGSYGMSTIAQLPSGKILIGQFSRSAVMLTRYNSDGSIDTSFSSDQSNTWSSNGSHGTLQPDGKMLMAWSDGIAYDENFVLARYTIDGSLDTSFGTAGKTSINFGGPRSADNVRCVSLQRDGKILVGGYSYDSSLGRYDFAIARLNSNGSLDNEFGFGGKVLTDFGGNDICYSIVQQSDGRIVAIGLGPNVLVISRYNTDGSLDASFSPPVNTLTASPSYTENNSPVVLDANIQILDTELAVANSYNGATLTLQRHGFANSQEVFSAATGVLTTLNTGSFFAVDSVTIGRVTTNSAGILTLTFNANATQALVNKAMQQIAYANNSDAPPATVQIDWIFNDGNIGAQGTGGALSVTGSTTVKITAVNDPPVLSVQQVDQTSRVGSPFTFNIPDGSFNDPDLEVLSYSVKMADGTAVPPWLVFNAATKTFTGTPSAFDVGAIDIQVTAKDAAGLSASDVFRVTVNPANSLPTGGITVTGSAAQGQTLTASSTLSDSDGLGTLSFQWKAAGTNIAGATTSTLTLTEAQVGKTITVTTSYTDGHGTIETLTSNASATVANVNDVPTGTVTITGTPTQGQTLTAFNSIADVDGLGSITYQWAAAGVPISGATASTLALAEAQVGKAITVSASYTDGHGTAEAVASAPSSSVANVNDTPIGAVTITGTVTQGQTLTASNNITDADGIPTTGSGAIAYQWKATGSVIGGATGSTLILTQDQVGKAIAVIASYTDGHGSVESVSSASSSTVVNVNDAPTGTVSISGPASRDQVLTASNTLVDLDGLGTITYQWKANGTNIANATGSTYKLTQTEVGQAITVSASYTDGFGKAESVSSAPTNLVTGINTAPTGSVTISGSASQGQQLTAANTLADTDGLGVFSYVWKANGQTIAGATSSTFTPTESQVGKTVTVSISYTDGHGTFETITSPTTLAVENVNDLPTGGVTISGTSSQGQTLTAASTVADLDGLGTFSYQWKSDGVVISNATASTFTLTELQVGKTLTVVASYTDGHGTKESVASGATSAVSNVNDTPTGNVTIAGVATQGQTLSVTNSLADPDGLGTISYQWKANGTAILSATADSLTLGESQVGKTITVTASYTDGHGTVEAVTSSATATVTNVNDVPTGSVVIAGTPIQGQTLTASNSIADADGLGTISYQWAAAGAPISGAVGSTLILAEAQVGKPITVVASYTDGHATTETLTSAATNSVANFNDVPTGAVTISGTATQGQTLTATNTLADADGLGTVTYQWLANGIAIGGGTTNTLALAEAQVAKTITVKASYSDGHGTLESATSSATNAVANVNDAPTGTVTITGNTSLGQVLTAANTLADLDGLGTIGYQWSADGTAISGATSNILTLTDAHLGKALTVTASYTDGHGTAESLNSSATSLITNVPPQTITGTAGNDSSLTGGKGNDAIDGLAGLDTAAFTSRMAAYSITPDASNTAISGPDGSDTLTSIERLQFLDANLAFDLDGNAGQVYRLYQAAFNRTPDLSGLGGWIAAMDDGMSLLTIASKFMESAEFQSLYGANPTNAQFVANLYTNALHRPSQQDAGSAAGWVNQLASNTLSKAQALVNFSESAENKASVLPVISGGITYATAAQATGPAKGQSFAGTPNTDSLIGTVGNDTFTGGAGNDTIEGGKGLDTAVYSGTKSSHTIARTATSMTVAGDSDGTDTLTNVERLKFDDAILAMDTVGNAGQTYRLYQAAFNRTPDKAGLSDWVKGMDTGLTLTQMATAFIGSGEFKDKYGANPTNAQFVDLLYANALHRARAVGDDYWTHQLDSGVTREQALIGFSESAENQASLIGVIQNGIELAVG